MDAMREMLAIVGDRVSQGPTFAYLSPLLARLFGPWLAEKARLPAMVGLRSLAESACIVAMAPIAGMEMRHRDPFVVGRTSTEHDRPGRDPLVLAADRRASPTIDGRTGEPLPTTSW